MERVQDVYAVDNAAAAADDASRSTSHYQVFLEAFTIAADSPSIYPAAFKTIRRFFAGTDSNDARTQLLPLDVLRYIARQPAYANDRQVLMSAVYHALWCTWPTGFRWIQAFNEKTDLD